jgi:glucokinase
MTARPNRSRGFPLSSRPVLALDLGGTQIRAAVVLADGSRLSRNTRPTPVDEGPAAVLDAAAEALHEARITAGEPGREVLAIGISCPGPIDPWAGLIVSPPNLGPAFRGMPIAALLEERLGLPAWLERDTNVAALGEMAYGAARGCRDFLYLTVSTGFGGAIVSNGSLILGPDGTAGELGHLQVDRDGPLCGCGGSGHVEAYCSGRALARDGQTAVETGRSAFLSERSAGASGAVDAHDVADGEAAGDPVCAALMDRARAAFAAAIVGAVNLLNPSLIIVGGSIAEHQGDRLFAPARNAVSIGTFAGPGRRVSIVPAMLGGDVSLAGAHPLVASRFGDPVWSRASAPSRSALPA